MKKLYALTVFSLCIFFGLNAQIMVTFQVDMNQEALDNGISENGVHVAGDFQGWDPAGTMMEDPEFDGIYTVTVPIADGTEIQYKYVNDNDWGADEPDNRMYTVSDDGDGTDLVPLVCFKSADACTNAGVTFTVDMNDEIISGEFDATTGKVYVAGDFQGWMGDADELTDPDGDGVYSGTFTLDEGDIEYKFVKNGTDFETLDDPDNECTVLGGFGNRRASVKANTTLPVYCYGKCGACEFTVAPEKWQVTFQVDMSNMVTQFGALDSVYAAGSFQGWTPGEPGNALTDPDGDGIYIGVDSVVDGTYQFKYLYGNDWGFDETGLVSLDCGMDNGGNREFTVEGGEVMLDPFCFNTCEVNCEALPEAVDVTFILDLSSEIPSSGGIFIKGSFQWPQFTDAEVQLNSLGGGIYSTDPVTLIPGEVTFVFSNGPEAADNENALFNDLGCGVTNPVGTQLRLLDLTGVTGDTTVGYIWNKCEFFTSNKDLLLDTRFEVYPNPLSEESIVEFDNPQQEVFELSMTDLMGRQVQLITGIRNEQVLLNRRDLAAGVYFLTLRNERGQYLTRKLIVE